MRAKAIVLMLTGLILVLKLRGVRADAPATSAPATSEPVAGDKIDNPLYSAWAKFDVGASVTFEGDQSDSSGGKFHLTATLTLKSKDADGAKADASMQLGSKENTRADVTNFPAKVGSDDVKPLKDEDVDAMGKTIKCKVYQVSPATVGGQGNTSVKVYLNDEIPGGIVKMDMGADDKGGSLIVTAVKK
jgi:hypothetical protein